MLGSLTTVAIFVLAFLVSGIKILREYERGVIFRLGRLMSARGPGLIYVVPLIERMQRVDLRTVTMEIPAQDVITRDNVSVKVSAVLYFRVVNPNLAVVQVENFLYATLQLSQTTLRSICGQVELDELLSEREKLNARIQEIIDAQSAPWGIKVVLVELKHIDLPHEMQRAIARQAEAERERRAKIINAEGEYQAAQRLAEAAQVIEPHPVALQLRYLQTLGLVAAGNPSTTIFPIPVDMFTPFLRKEQEDTGGTQGQPSSPKEGPS